MKYLQTGERKEETFLVRFLTKPDNQRYLTRITLQGNLTYYSNSQEHTTWEPPLGYTLTLTHARTPAHAHPGTCLPVKARSTRTLRSCCLYRSCTINKQAVGSAGVRGAGDATAGRRTGGPFDAINENINRVHYTTTHNN